MDAGPTHASATASRTGRWLAAAAPALALFAGALAVRSLGWPEVFTERGLRLVGPDAHYHLRRIAWSVEHFPSWLSRDEYVAFPNGGEPIWSPLFDWLLAGLGLVFVGTGNDSGLERLLVWAPPLLGAATVVATWAIARAHFGPAVAIAAGAMGALLPSQVWYSQLGFVDHHAAVALATTGLLGAAMALFAVLPEDPRTPRRSVWLGVAMAAALLVWPGCALHVGAVQLALAGRLAVMPALGAAPAATVSVARSAALAHAVAFALVLPFSAGPLLAGEGWEVWGPLSPVVLSGFQPLWLGLAAVGFGAAAVVLDRAPAEAGSGHRIARALLALAVPALAALALPAVREGAAEAWTWLGRGERFQALVLESTPLLREVGSEAELTLRRAQRAFSPLIYALPLWLAALAVSVRVRRQPELALLIAWALVLFAATLAQYRFANSFSVAWSLVVAGGVQSLARAVWGHWPGTAARAGISAGILVCVAAVVGEASLAQSHRIGRMQRVLRGEPVVLTRADWRGEALIDLAHWLREASPETSGWLEPKAKPEYGVLAPWGDGHVLRYRARRPVVQDNFGDDVGTAGFALADAYFEAENEARAVAELQRAGVRYVVAREAGSGHAEDPYEPKSMAFRLTRLGGAAGGVRAEDAAEGAERTYVPALTRHRLLYESPASAGDEAGGLYKLYEIVPGARAAGRAIAGAVVEVRLRLEGGPLPRDWVAYTRANEGGRYDLVLPYATTAGAPPASGARVATAGGVTPSGSYRLLSGRSRASLEVDEETVRGGRRVEAPDLAP